MPTAFFVFLGPWIWITLLAMAMGAFHFRSITKRKKFLFFSWGQEDVNFWTAAQKLTLNQSMYAPLREIVKSKLGVSAANYLAKLEL